MAQNLKAPVHCRLGNWFSSVCLTLSRVLEPFNLSQANIGKTGIRPQDSTEVADMSLIV